MNALFFGLLSIDFHYFTDHFPVQNAKTRARSFDSYIGGPATNAAITFDYLGGSSTLVTAIGDNPCRGMVNGHLSDYNLRVVDMKKGKSARPAVASIITEEVTGDRTIIYHLPEHVELFIKNDLEFNFDIALFDGFYMEKAIEVAAICRHQGITTVFDGGSWKKGTDELLKYIDVAICSEDFSPPGSIKGDDIASWLINAGVKKAAITRGAKPIVINEGDANLLINVQKTKIVDTLAAGDIFHGAFCYFYAEVDDFPSAIEKAAQVATFSCRYRGPREWMNQRP